MSILKTAYRNESNFSIVFTKIRQRSTEIFKKYMVNIVKPTVFVQLRFV